MVRERTWAKQVATHGKLLEWSGILDVGKGGLELLELGINLLLGLLGFFNLVASSRSAESPTPDTNRTHSLGLKGLDSLNGRGNVVCHRLEVFEQLLRLVDDGLVLQDGAVMGKVNGCRLVGIVVGQSLGIGVTLAEGLEGGNGFCSRYSVVLAYGRLELPTFAESQRGVNTGEVLQQK